MIEKHLCLREAARQAGVGSKALKRWLAKELGICFPKVPRGSKIMVRERDVELVLARHRDARAARDIERVKVGAR
jgi:AraC-like DNA-binding protein